VSVTSSTNPQTPEAEAEARRDGIRLVRWHPTVTTKWLVAIVAASALALISYLLVPRLRSVTPVAARPITAYQGFAVHPSISPDGNKVAFEWGLGPGSNVDIYVKSLESGDPQRLTTNPARDVAPAWSPDGRLLAFARSTGGQSFGGGQGAASQDLMVMPAAGGVERKVATMQAAADALNGLAWAPDGKWIAVGGRPSEDDPGGIWLVAVHGESRRPLTNAPSDSRECQPVFSPDGTRLAFLRRTGAPGQPPRASVHILSLSADLTPSGPPMRVASEEGFIRGLAWTPDGRGLMYTAMSGPRSTVKRIATTRGSEEAPMQPEPMPFASDALELSIAGSGRLVYSAPFRDVAVWKLPLGGLIDRPSAIPPLNSPFDEETPDYSPDGKRLTFGSTRSGGREIWIANADGSSAVQMTSIGGAQTSNPRWSPDGRTILFDSGREGSADLYLLQLDTRELRRLTDDPGSDVMPRWSRDGRSIYFNSDRTGRYEIWRMPAAGGAPVQMTQHGGTAATESPDGRYLYYAKGISSPTAIWRMPVGGGEETLVVEGSSFPQNFVVADRGIYFVAIGRRVDDTSIDFIEHSTGARTTIVKLGKLPWYGTALSPDQQSMLYTTIESIGSNLMLVEGFR